MTRATMKMAVQTRQRQALLGRLKMADWIEMPEREFAQEIASIERDPLFKKLYFGQGQSSGVIRRQRWPRGRMAGSLFEINEAVLSGGGRVRVEELLSEGEELLPKIRQMGREAFEKFFLFAEEALPAEELARRTGLTVPEVEQVNDLLLKIGAEAEFVPARLEAAPAAGQVCLARLSVEDGEPEFEFFSPYWARGLYQIRYDLLEDLKQSGTLAAEDVKKLPRLLKRLETVNLRQNTVFRIMESVTQLQAEYLASRREQDKRPISLRMLARRLDLAPSTVSRAISGRSVLLPWGREAALIQFLPGRRRVLREILALWFKEAPGEPDSFFTDRLRQERGIKVSRRTVNAVRHELVK